MFIFLIGIMGVLAVFPVAMNSASQTIGEARSNILAQSAIAQISSDCKVVYEKGETNADGTTIIAPNRELKRASSIADFTGYFVTLTTTSGADKGRKQSRLITGFTSETLHVFPDWDILPVYNAVPDLCDSYVITRLGLPDARIDETVARSGYVYKMAGANGFHAGSASGEDCIPLTWPAPTNWTSGAVSPGVGVSVSSAGGNTLTIGSAPWLPNDHRGKLVVITGPDSSAARGQARFVIANTTDTLTVYPDWAVTPAPNDTFEFRNRLGYFVLFTNGRAAGRMFPISGHSPDATDGDVITCEGADWTDIGITEAEGPITAGVDYKLARATSFMIVGSDSVFGCIAPNRSETVVAVGEQYTDRPVTQYYFNAFGFPKTAEPQTGQDVHFTGVTEQETSAFSAVCIFSDNGAIPDDVDKDGAPDTLEQQTAYAQRLPVRVDVITFLNYDRAKSPADNRKPVGHMTGYIGR